MKKNINDYKGTKTAIEVNSIEEFDKIKKLLGHNQKGSNCFKENKNYISCYSDDYCDKQYWINAGFTLYKASDFLEEVPKFEEGKWYKVNDKYTKFLILENESLIFGSEHIYNNKHYISELKTGTWISKLSDNPVLLTDLSEIQQYLPSNHPDLIAKEFFPEYVECIKGNNTTKHNQLGKIYKVKDYNQKTGFLQIDDNYIINIYFGEKALGNNNVIDYKLSTKTAYEAQNKLTEDDLLTNEIYEFDTKKLIIGEIYYRHNFIFDHVSKINYSRNNTAISITEKAFFNGDCGMAAYNEKPERLATDEEKKWLKVCKNENKFIPKENLHFYDDSGLLIKKKLIKQIEEGLDLTDRWIKCIKKCDWEDINIGEYVQIKSKGIIANVEWKNKDGYYLNLKRVEETKQFELMPEGFSPYEFKIGDYLYIIDYGIEQISPKDSVLQITNIEETYLGKWITYINIKTRWEGKFRQHHFIDNIRKATEKEILDYLSDNYHRQNPLAPKESFFTETDKMIINGFVMGNGQIFQNNIDSEDIYIIPITKRKKEIQTITIESITNLNLNLKTIKPKQIQTIKI